ncbi:NBS-containing resistance-like protein, partial [Trifolium medium]|nr:NBS-containing resistance-like protein [Trifolium medium]
MKSYDVYLSFCDEDASSFALDLYTALSSEAGVVVFWDDERIGSVDHREIPTSVLNVIGDCKVAVIVFSVKYVNSISFLQELEKITECCRITDGFMVMPVFYDGVRLSFGIFERDLFGGKAFHDFVDKVSKEEIFQEKDKFMSWVAAITSATIDSGESSDLEDG